MKLKCRQIFLDTFLDSWNKAYPRPDGRGFELGSNKWHENDELNEFSLLYPQAELLAIEVESRIERIIRILQCIEDQHYEIQYISSGHHYDPNPKLREIRNVIRQNCEAPS